MTEILVVVAILAVLGSLIAAGVFGLMGSTQKGTTETTILTVHKMLMQHWQHVIEEAKKEPLSPGVLAWAGGAGQEKRARVLWIKLRLMEAFPTKYAEVNHRNIGGTMTPYVYTLRYPANTGALLIPAGQAKYQFHYQSVLGKTTLRKANDRITESAACLLLALSIDRSGHSLSAEQLKILAKDTDGDGLPELVDAWSNPMLFFRFPTQYAGLAAACPNPGANFRDPLDPYGMLLPSQPTNLPTSWGNPGSGGRKYFNDRFHAIGVSATQSLFTTPALVSSGGFKLRTADNSGINHPGFQLKVDPLVDSPAGVSAEGLDDSMVASDVQGANMCIHSFKLRY